MARLNKEKYKGRTINMIIDPFFKGDLFDEYPFLENIPQDIVGDVRIQDFVRASAFILDPNSPIVKEYTDLKDRRELVYEMLCYQGHKDIKVEVWMLINIYKKNDWTQLCANQFRFDDLATMAFEPIDKGADDDKKLKSANLSKKLLDDMYAINENSEILYAKLFFGNQELLDIAKNVAMTPEMRAKRYKNAESN